MKEKKEFIEIGQIVNTHGLKGEVKVDPWCNSPEFMCQFKKVYLKDGTVLEITKSRVQKNCVLVKIKGVDSIEQADTMRKTVLYINRNDVSLDEGEYFIQDIIGCEIHDVDSNEFYGTVTDVLETGANDVYEIKKDGKIYLVPVIDDVIISTDIDSGIIKIRPMKGLFDDED